MATLISNSSGNLTASGTWSVVDTTSLSDTEGGNTALTTSFQLSAAFTPGAITIDGIAIKILARNSGSPTNTITVQLDQGGSLVTGTAVTMNVSDMAAFNSLTITGGSSGWYFFQFASPVTLLAATAYTVAIKLSATTTPVSPFTSGSAADWSRMLRTTTNAAPGAGDFMHIMGSNTAAGSHSAYTVTMDDTGTNVYGSNTTPWTTVPTFTISMFGTMSFGTSASTNYQFNVKGIQRIYGGGTLNIGTGSTKIPASSTALYNQHPTASGDTVLFLSPGATLSAYGDSTYGNVVACNLNADASATNTTITTDVSTGWNSGDTIVIASTSRTPGDVESRTLNGAASGTTITLNSGLTNAHSGTSPTQGEIINLTRNVKFTGVSTSVTGVLTIPADSLAPLGTNVVLSYVEFSFACCNPQNSIGTVGIDHCSFHDITGGTIAAFMTVNGTLSTLSVSYCVFYNSAGQCINLQAQTNTNASTFDHIWMMKGGSNAIINNSGGPGAVMTNFWINSTSGNGVDFTGANALNTTMNNFNIHSNTTAGTLVVNGCTNPLTTWVVWRNAGPLTIAGYRGVSFNGLTMFGNSTTNIQINQPGIGPCFFDSLVLSGDTTFSTPVGISIAAASQTVTLLYLTNSTLGAVSGIKTAHTTADIQFTGLYQYCRIIMENCNLASSTPVSGMTTANAVIPQSFISSQKDAQTTGSHKFYMANGIGTIDTTIYHTASPSLRLTPSNASGKMPSSPPAYGMKAAVQNTGSITMTVWIRTSVVGDGAAYNGNPPRLIVRKNVSAGISLDTVIATFAGSTGTWTSVSGTTSMVTDDSVLEFFVDCDGTAGWINVDDFVAS